VADSAIEEIKRRIDIVDLVSQTVQLQRAGRSFKGLCPFHSEKTPSFHVSPERGSWHCFGCGEGGDIFSFVQRRDNVEFVEALRMLAEQADVELERSSRPDPTRQQRRERLHALLESAALYYRAALTGARWPAARTYFEGRGISAETSERFGLGYAEPSGRGLAQHLVQAGFGLDEAVAAGALGQADDGRTYDRFRDRVIFPIRDAEGRMIGLGGRTLGDQQPKYLNSPQTDLFDKGGSLYALDQARTAIREARQAVVVEGYMDALIAHQHGFRNVVATLGTAITERHMEVLRRLAQEVILALDADAAGQRATLRGLEVARESLADESPTILRVRGLGRFFGDRRTQVKAMILPTGRDPDEVIREDPALWKRLAGQALPVVDFVLESLGRQHDLTSAAGRRDAAREAMTVIQDLPDPVERAHYIQRLARLLNVREEFLLQAAQTRPRRAPTSAEAGSTPPGGELESARRYEDRLEDHVLALILRAPGDAPRPEPTDFESATHRAILEQLTGGSERRDPALALDSLVQELGPAVEPTIGRVRAADEENGRLTPEEATKELRVRILELRKLRLFRQHQALNSVLAEAERLSAAERQEYQTRLAHLTANLGDVFAQQRELGAVGTTSWSVRRGQEVLGG
jgi:DNA primase